MGSRRAHSSWVVVGRVVWLAVCVLLLAAGFAGAALGQARGEAHVVEIDGIISPITERYVERAIGEADRAGAEVVVVLLDTPGGLLDATRGIVAELLASPTPVVVYVWPGGGRAASAGTFITAAGHVAAMAPGTNIGAASPVSGSGDELPETLRSKAFQDAAAEMRAIAEVRGRPVEPLEATVLEAASYTANEALDLGIVDYVAGDVGELLALIDGATVVVRDGETEREVTLDTDGAARRAASMSVFDKLLSFLADPNVAYLLISLGGVGLFVELWSPGLIFPGVAGIVMLALGLMALGSLPGNWVGVALIALAFVLFTLEFTFDGSGLLAALGVLCLVLGGVVLFWHMGAPSPVLPQVGVSPWALAPVAIVGGGGVILFAREMQKARRSLIGAPLPEPVTTGAAGVVVEPIPAGGEGKVRVRGEIWTARAADGGAVESGAAIVVRETRGPLLEVERAEESESA